MIYFYKKNPAEIETKDLVSKADYQRDSISEMMMLSYNIKQDIPSLAADNDEDKTQHHFIFDCCVHMNSEKYNNISSIKSIQKLLSTDKQTVEIFVVTRKMYSLDVYKSLLVDPKNKPVIIALEPNITKNTFKQQLISGSTCFYTGSKALAFEQTENYILLHSINWLDYIDYLQGNKTYSQKKPINSIKKIAANISFHKRKEAEANFAFNKMKLEYFESQYFNALRDLQYNKDILAGLEGTDEKIAQKIEDDIGKIKEFPIVNDIYIEQTNLVIITNPFRLLDYKIGYMRITIGLDNTPRVKFYRYFNPEDNVAFSNDYPHPHASSDGHSCMGTFREKITKLVAQYEIFKSFLLINEFLSRYNEASPLRKLTTFPKWTEEDENKYGELYK